MLGSARALDFQEPAGQARAQASVRALGLDAEQVELHLARVADHRAGEHLARTRQIAARSLAVVAADDQEQRAERPLRALALNLPSRTPSLGDAASSRRSAAGAARAKVGDGAAAGG